MFTFFIVRVTRRPSSTGSSWGSYRANRWDRLRTSWKFSFWNFNVTNVSSARKKNKNTIINILLLIQNGPQSPLQKKASPFESYSASILLLKLVNSFREKQLACVTLHSALKSYKSTILATNASKFAIFLEYQFFSFFILY